MSQLEPLFLIGMGAVTPVGRDCWSSAAAVRAGVSGFHEHPFMVDTAGAPMVVCTAPWLDGQLDHAERLTTLMFGAIDEAIERLLDTIRTDSRLALAAVISAPRPGQRPDLKRHVQESVRRHYGGRFSAVAAFQNGHAGAFLALDAAAKRMSEGAFDAIVVVGADSLVHPLFLDWLDEKGQLQGAGRLNNAWGYVPGEAAGAIVLANARFVRQRSLRPLARVVGIGIGTEKNVINTDTVCIGEGLTQAFRSVVRALPPGNKVTDVYSDLNGQPYRSDEYGFAVARTTKAFEKPADLATPADCWGDVAAASGPLGMTLALVSALKGYSSGGLALVFGSSESGERGAVLLAAELQ